MALATAALGTDGDVALSASNLTRRFGKGADRCTALDAINLEVRRGQVTGLVGPDGAGKTTFMRLACGLLRADAGTLTVLGKDVAIDPQGVQAEVRYMPQRFGLYEDLSVAENLALYADLQGLPLVSRAARYAELMQMTGLAPFMTRLAGRLSGGMKQKLGVACALLKPPRLLLLDEPTVGVDPVSRRELWAIVDRMVQDTGTTVLLSTAYLDEAERCAEVIVLHEGRVIATGKPGSFSAGLAGRTFLVSAPGVQRRALATSLQASAQIIDAVIQGDEVRIITTTTEVPTAATLGLAVPCTISPVTPRFEDGFVTHIKDRRGPEGRVAAFAMRPVPGGREVVIRTENLERRFGDFYAVRELDLAVRRGEVFGLLGANGAGKSTTFRMLCGLLPPSNGQIEVAGVDLRTAPADARARIGYMAQRFSLYGNLTVRENLRFFASAYGLSGSARAERISWALNQFDLADHAEAGSDSLPLGFKQRLAMAAALMHEPEILFLDEPTSGVDPLARRDFWQRINALAEAGVTVLVTTHFMEEAEYCDRLAIMAAGRVLALGTPAEIKAQTADERGPASSLEEAFIRLATSRAEAA